ncbi:hypothetical protein EAE99_005893 [Botrytis elliptica]|nr:hypothetical protein EAE99_005893 [Botrytis elliptica]
MASATTQQDTFHPFPRIPLELRLKIWRLSFPGPRLTRIFFIEGHFMSNATIPTGLHVCKESRNETLRFYKLCFAAEPSKARIYFNVDCDVPHLKADPLDSYFYELHNVFTGGMKSPVNISYLRLFSKAHAAIRNDMKAVCLEGCRYVAPGYEGRPMHLFGPNCRVFDFHGNYFGTPNLYYGETSRFGFRERVEEVFGTSKFTHIDDHPSYFRDYESPTPYSLPSGSLGPLIEQVWAADLYGFNDIVWQFIEQKVNTTGGLVRNNERLV